ncbi:MAG: hypothetical protein IPK53_09745 [bacterium]|nr:hypothetical protein [bacterium]
MSTKPAYLTIVFLATKDIVDALKNKTTVTIVIGLTILMLRGSTAAAANTG